MAQPLPADAYARLPPTARSLPAQVIAGASSFGGVVPAGKRASSAQQTLMPAGMWIPPPVPESAARVQAAGLSPEAVRSGAPSPHPRLPPRQATAASSQTGGFASSADVEYARRLQRDLDREAVARQAHQQRARHPVRAPPVGGASEEAREASGSAGRADEECARELQRQFDREVAEKEAKEQFPCPLCMETARLDQGVELDCLHRICRECFTSYLEVKIREKRVASDELICPMPSCGCEVTVPQVEGATQGTALWERFLASRAELWRPDNRQEERLCECPVPSCQGLRFVAPAEFTEVQCPQCHSVFCPSCRQQHPGVTCEAHAATQKASGVDADEDFEALVRQQCWQRCPCCSAVCERPHGCNFMTCYSEQCRGKKYFCYLCGIELTSSQHFSHFPHGLFENACEKVDRRCDENMPKATWGTPEWWGAIAVDVRNWALGHA